MHKTVGMSDTDEGRVINLILNIGLGILTLKNLNDDDVKLLKTHRPDVLATLTTNENDTPSVTVTKYEVR